MKKLKYFKIEENFQPENDNELEKHFAKKSYLEKILTLDLRVWKVKNLKEIKDTQKFNPKKFQISDFSQDFKLNLELSGHLGLKINFKMPRLDLVTSR